MVEDVLEGLIDLLVGREASVAEGLDHTKKTELWRDSMGSERSVDKGQAILTLRCKSIFCSFLSTGSVTAVEAGCSPISLVAGGRDIQNRCGVTFGASQFLCRVSGGATGAMMLVRRHERVELVIW